jgi:hypothetical protein
MQVGLKLPITDKISNQGFKFAEAIHIFGMDIYSNFDKTIGSLQKSVNYWERFDTFRWINVLKRLPVPLLFYISCFLMPSIRNVKTIRSILNTFVVGSLNFAKKRIKMAREQR